jgi:hypothetical protein
VTPTRAESPHVSYVNGTCPREKAQAPNGIRPARSGRLERRQDDSELDGRPTTEAMARFPR